MPAPLQIGVTGGIGSGKSVVCALFSCLGIPVYNADSRAKWLTNYHAGIKKQVIDLLGSEAYNSEGRYNTAFVSSVVFQNEPLLRELNAIIHPIVQEDTAAWVNANRNAPYLIKEAAIMKAAGDGNSLDYVVIVQAPEALRIARILNRDKRTEQEIRAIIARQVSDEMREKIADFVISNDENAALIPQVTRLHQHFLTLSAS